MPISRGACRDFLDDFSGFVDGTLDAYQRSLLIAHLDCCEPCLRHLRAYRKGVAAFREAEPREPAGGLYDRVVERLGEGPVIHPGATPDTAMDHGVRPALGAVGAGLVMAIVALFVIVPQAGRLGSPERGPNAGTAATLGDAPTSWASVIPAALPLSAIGSGATDGFRSADALARSVRTDRRLAIDELPEVPRREVRVARFDGVTGSVPASAFAGWPPRRPPIVIDRGATVYTATWIAEAALRIP